MTTRGKIAVAVLLGSAVLAGLIAWGARRADRGEGTWFNDARDRAWAVTPVDVTASADVLEKYGAQVTDAVKRINDEVGCTILTTQGQRTDIRIISSVEDSPCANAGLATNPDDDGAITHVCAHTTDIVLEREGWHHRQAYLILKHELLHALGIDHDPSGLMAPRHPDWNWGGIDVSGEMISWADRHALKVRYCMVDAGE